MAWQGSFRFRLLVLAGAAAGVGLLVLLPPGQHGFYPVCPVHAWTGLLCPGCGGTRALAALLRGDLTAAWAWNQMVVALAPFGVGYLAGSLATGRVLPLPRGVGILLATIALAFTVWRNLA